MPIVINGSAGTVTGVATGGLPDGIVDADMLASNAVTAGKLASGVGGKILQTLTSSNNSTITTSGAAISDLTTVTITPASSSNKILLFGNCTLYTNPNNNAYAGAYLYRGTNTGSKIWEVVSGNSTTNGTYWPYTLICLDSPNTTSAQTYTFCFSRQSINTTSVTTGTNQYSLTALEIAA